MSTYALSGPRYDVGRDCLVRRVSMCDAVGGEFWREVAVEPTRTFRDRRDEALDAIEAAIGDGREPGEVTT